MSRPELRFSADRPRLNVCCIASIAEAVRQVRPFGVDVCFGLKTDGRFDEEELVRFVAKLEEAG
jgi:hypothetical protein